MTEHTRWSDIRKRLLADPEVRAGYEATGRAIKLGMEVRRLREARGMSQSELAHCIHSSQSAIARLEAGSVDPKLGTLERLSSALGADLILELRTPEPVA